MISLNTISAKRFVSLENINNLAKIAGDKINFFFYRYDSYDWHIVREVLRKKL